MGASALLRDRTTVGGAAAQRRSAPSYATLRRFLKANGLDKRRRVTLRQTAGADRAEARLLDREVRSYEAAYVNGLWHWDCHHGSRKVLTARGEWQTPILFGVLDDRSRLACHLQWYLAETAEIVAHGLSQAFQKRGLPRSGLSDNGPAMTAAEITEGLRRLGILHHTTLPYSPYQNAKQEAEGAFGGDIDYAQLVKLYGLLTRGATPRRFGIGRSSLGECCHARLFAFVRRRERQIRLLKVLGYFDRRDRSAIRCPKSTISRELSRKQPPSERYSLLHAAGAINCAGGVKR